MSNTGYLATVHPFHAPHVGEALKPAFNLLGSLGLTNAVAAGFGVHEIDMKGSTNLVNFSANAPKGEASSVMNKLADPAKSGLHMTEDEGRPVLHIEGKKNGLPHDVSVDLYDGDAPTAKAQATKNSISAYQVAATADGKLRATSDYISFSLNNRKPIFA